MSDLLEFYQDQTEVMVYFLETLINHESPTHNKARVDALGNYLREHLTDKLGAEIEIFSRERVGDITLAKWNADTDGQPILILVHLDTVWEVGTVANGMPFRRDESKVYGAGALDMKAGIVIALEAIRGLQERGEFPERPIWLLMTTDEETGSDESRAIITELAAKCGLCLVMEPATENEGIKTARKGIARYWVRAKGKSSHAGNAPEEGVNAIIELAHQAIAINQLSKLRDGTSVSVTRFSGGGSAGNVIPAEASLYVDVRFFYPAEAERVDTAIINLMAATFGSEIDVEGGIHRFPLERNEQVVAAYNQAKQLATDIGFDLGEGAVGGVSDGNLIAPLGIPVLDGLGGHGDGMHALHEHVLVRSLSRRAALVASILRDWKFEES